METLLKFTPISKPEDNLTREDFKNIGKSLPLVGIGIKHPVVSAGTSGAGRLIEGLAEREDLMTSLINAAKAMGSDIAVQKGLGKAGSLLKKPVSKIQGALTDAPPQAFENLIENPDLLKGSSLEGIVTRVRKSIEKQKKRLANLKKAEKKSVKSSSQSMAFGGKDLSDNKFISKITEKMNQMEGATARFSEGAKNNIREVLALIKNDPSLEGQVEILRKVDSYLDSTGAFKRLVDRIKKPKKLTDEQSVLWDIASKLRQRVKGAAKGKLPNIQNIRDISNKKLTALDSIRDRFVKGKKSKQVFDISKESPYGLMDDMQKFDDLLPQKEKFLKEAISLVGTDRITPSLSRVLLTSGAGLSGGPLLMAATAAATSPRAQRKLIQASPLFKRTVGKMVAASQTPIQRNQDGSYTEETKQNLRR